MMSEILKFPAPDCISIEYLGVATDCFLEDAIGRHRVPAEIGKSLFAVKWPDGSDTFTELDAAIGLACELKAETGLRIRAGQEVRG